MIKWPTKLAGSGALTRWLNLFLRASQASEIVEGSDYRLQRTTKGTIIKFKTGSGGGGDYKTFKLCRNGQSITVRIDSLDDPTTAE